MKKPIWKNQTKKPKQPCTKRKLRLHKMDGNYGIDTQWMGINENLSKMRGVAKHVNVQEFGDVTTAIGGIFISECVANIGAFFL